MPRSVCRLDRTPGGGGGRAVSGGHQGSDFDGTSSTTQPSGPGGSIVADLRRQWRKASPTDFPATATEAATAPPCSGTALAVTAELQLSMQQGGTVRGGHPGSDFDGASFSMALPPQPRRIHDSSSLAVVCCGSGGRVRSPTDFPATATAAAAAPPCGPVRRHCCCSGGGGSSGYQGG